MNLLSSPRDYLRSWLQLNNVTVAANGNLIGPSTGGRTTMAIFNTIWLDYSQTITAAVAIERMKAPALRTVVGKFVESDLLKALHELIDMERILRRRECVLRLKFSGIENLAPLEAYTKALVGFSCPTTMAALAHFICQVKRKMQGKKVHNHLLSVLVGAQGGGKSVAIELLVAPVKDYTLAVKTTHLTDDRWFESFSKNFVGVLEELSAFDRADNESLKAILTASNVDYREMRTTTTVSVPQNCSFIGNSNRPLNEVLNDPTGVRRFYEIKVLDKLDWAALNSLDYEAMWTGIDEDKDYFSTVQPEIQAAQARMKTVDEIQEFIDDYGILAPIVGSPTIKVSAAELYSHYVLHCNHKGIKPRSGTWMGTHFGNRTGIRSVPHKDSNNRTTRFYELNADCAIKSYDAVSVSNVISFRNHE